MKNPSSLHKHLKPRLIAKDGKLYTAAGALVEMYEGKYQVVVDDRRSGWWRFHSHYDRQGYCDNPARGY